MSFLKRVSLFLTVVLAVVMVNGTAALMVFLINELTLTVEALVSINLGKGINEEVALRINVVVPREPLRYLAFLHGLPFI